VKLTDRQELTVPIVLMNSKRVLSLKPGQTANTLDGSIKENFEQPGLQNQQLLNLNSK
jgi:hypothetical protein